MKINEKNNLNHLAIIMDGNVRWAKKHLLPPSAGHKAGAENIKKLFPAFINLGIKHLTLFAFSTENWNRGVDEISNLLNLFTYYLDNFIDDLNKYGCKLNIIGNLTKLDPSIIEKINNATNLTKNNKKITLYIAFSYSGREEILHAAEKMMEKNITDFTEENFRKCFYAPQMPDIDLLIRTSGRSRISNFALWHMAYSEIIFSKKLWPDFKEDDLLKSAEQFRKKQRTLGGRAR